MPLEVSVPLETSSLARRAYELLHEQIMKGNLEPGERLDIHVLAQKLKISRTPIKEAVNYLAQEGLVTIHNRRGTFVSTFKAKNIKEVFEVRLMIELWSVEQALRHPGSLNVRTIEEVTDKVGSLFDRAGNFDFTSFNHFDWEFHLAIVDAARNSRLSALYRSLQPHIQVVDVRRRERRRALESYEEHRRILEALQQADLGAAVAALTTHITMSRDYYLKVLPTASGSRQ